MYGRRRYNKTNKRYYKKKYTKNNYVKKYKPKNNKYSKGLVQLTLRGNLSGFPDAMNVKLNYVERIGLSGTPNVDYIFRGNSIFDPNYTGTGHQPMYANQYAPIYQRYRVHASSIRVDAINQSTSEAAQIALIPKDTFDAITDLGTAQEYSRAVETKMIPISQQYPVRIKNYCTTRKAMGMTKTEANSDFDLTGLTGTTGIGNNPAQLWWWHIVAESTDAIATVNTVILVKITYYVKFYELLNTARSN